MPPRLNKRQQRELEELEELKLGKQSQGLDLSSEEEEEPTSSIRRAVGGFSNVRSIIISNLTIIIANQFRGSSYSKMTMSRASRKRKKKPRQWRNARFTLIAISIFNRWYRTFQSKKKKKPTTSESTSVIETLAQDVSTTKEATKQKRTTTPVPAVKNEKKALKKAKAREKKAANDELDQVLAELSIQYGFMLCSLFPKPGLTSFKILSIPKDIAS
jgi:hypothetical protein